MLSEYTFNQIKDIFDFRIVELFSSLKAWHMLIKQVLKRWIEQESTEPELQILLQGHDEDAFWKIY